MIDIALDPLTNDILLVEDSAQLVSGVDQIAQNLAIRLRFIRGEWYLNTLAGIPYYQYFFIKEPNQIQVETFLKDEIVGTNGVLEITSFESNYSASNRKYNVTFGCKTVDGTVQITQEL